MPTIKMSANTSQSQGPPVIVIGGANLDLKGRPSLSLQPKTSNPGVVKSSAGGVGRNIAHNLALLGVPVHLITAWGDDAAGTYIQSVTAAAGVNLADSLTVPGGRSGLYIALLERDGDLAVALADMAILENLTPAHLLSRKANIERGRLVVIDTNLPAPTLAVAVSLARQARIPLLAEPVSVEKARLLRDLLPDLDYVTPNREELEALVDGPVKSEEEIVLAAAKLRQQGVKGVVVTLGPRGIYLSSSAGDLFLPPYRGPVVDTTGAGDALAAGFVYGLYRGFDLKRAAACGLAAAALTVASPETVNPELKAEALQRLLG